jgi:CheY-like chemotaxis protein
MYSPNGRILCTEDNPDARELIVLMLEREGYHVTVTEDSSDALLLFQQEPFDLLLVDNWMPGLSGAELTRKVRKFNQTTPILFYSAAAFEANKQEAYEAGAQGYLVKPEGIDHLVDEVAKLIAEARIAHPK